MHYYITKTTDRKGGTGKFFAVLGIFFLCVLFFVGIFFWNTRAEVAVSGKNVYYFLVKDCEETSVSVVSGDVYRAGGAGFVMNVEGKTSVALSCYFSLEDAEAVQTTLAEKGTQTRVMTLSSEEIVFYGKQSSLCAEHVGHVLTTGRQCAQILYDTANGLERGILSQEEGLAAVEGVTKVMRGFYGDEELHGRWNVALGELVRRGEELSLGILFSKDVRYFQVQLCSSLAQISKYYS